MATWPRRFVIALLGLVLVLSVAGTVSSAGSPVMQTEEPNETVDGFDRVTFDITVDGNGTATWVFRYERQLETEDDRTQFETFANQFENETTGFFERRTAAAESLVETGSSVTGREMAARDFERAARIEQRTNVVGVVEVAFVWEGFAAVDGSSVVINDVLSGTYLGQNQVLVIRSGEGLSFGSVEPEAEYAGESLETAETVSWTGEQQFAPGQPYVELTAPTSGGGTPGWLIASGLVVLLIIGAAVWYRGVGRSGRSPPRDGTDDAPAVDVSDDDLMTDDDRVIQLIKDNGGRMKQVNIVEETGWSKSKVSMLLSEMEEEGSISKLRVGRENIISLEGFEPEATKSPLDE